MLYLLTNSSTLLFKESLLVTADFPIFNKSTRAFNVKSSSKSISSIKKRYKPKGIIALYYYYKFLLGFHKKNNIKYKLTPEMQKEVKKMEFYSEQIRFMCKYKLKTTDAVDELKTMKLREKQIILNKRNKLYYHRNKCNNEDDKDSITKGIIPVTDMLKKVKKEIKLCDVIYNNVPEMKQQIKEVEDKEQEKEIQHKKKRSYEL